MAQKRRAVSLSPAVYAALNAEAQRLGCSVSSLAEKAIALHCNIARPQLRPGHQRPLPRTSRIVRTGA